MHTLLQALQDVPSCALYVHVPFCLARCDYCSFCSVVMRPQQAARYAHTLERELERVLQAYSGCIRTLYVGGGNPLSWGYALLDKLCNSLSGALKSAKESTIEMNPESVDEQTVSLLTSRGFTRFSIGIQSFHPSMRDAIGRRGSVDDVYRSLDILAHISDKVSLNADLMTSVPGFTCEDTARDIDELVKRCAVHHISLYDLSVEEHTPLSARIASPSEEDMLSFSWEKLETLGYRQYELSNFALPGHECVHNRAYWTQQPYLGIGASAVSTVPVRGGGLRYALQPDVEGFSQAGMNLGEYEQLDMKTWFLEHIMLALRTAEGISLGEVARKFGRESSFWTDSRCSYWMSQGYMASRGEKRSLTQKGMLIMNTITSDFFLHADKLTLEPSLDSEF